MANSIWLAALERALNRRLQDAESAQAHLADLAGHSLGLQLVGLPRWIAVRAHPTGLTLHLHDDPETLDAAVRGSVVAWLRVAATAAEPGKNADRFTCTGDPQIADAFRVLLSRLSLDWEEELARRTGDLPAHYMGGALRALRAFASRGATSVGLTLAEYLRHEQAELTGPAEQRRFAAAVQQLQRDVDALAARIERLERPPAATGSTS